MVQGAEAQALIGGLHSPTSSGRLSLSFLRSPVSLHFGPQSSCNFQTLAPPPTPSRWLLLAAQVEEERGQMAVLTQLALGLLGAWQRLSENLLTQLLCVPGA